MSELQAVFDTPHDEAFNKLGALKPGQQWSAFDVARDEARDGKAKLFVTTIWNFDSEMDAKKRRKATGAAIARDKIDGTLWYRVVRPPLGVTRKTWVAHWNGLQLALDKKIPIVGVLKDITTNRCSLNNVFDCGGPRWQFDESAMWLQLRPRGQVGCDVRSIDIRQVAAAGLEVVPLAQVTNLFDAAVHEALQRSATERRSRLASARRLPRRIEVTMTVFNRNPDVVAEVLCRAGGRCEGCRKPAPFIRRTNGSPYLEVHHKVHLANDGEDTVENAMALCPNCHRSKHYA